MSDKLLNTFFKVESTHWWWMGRKKIVTNLLKKYLPGKKNVILDAGCGTGAEIIYLRNFGKVYGVDLSPIATKFCQKRGIENVKIGDVSKLPYKNNSFDLVCLMDVLEHTSKNETVLNEIHRVLKPKGLLLMTLPALPFIYSKHDRIQGHFKRYTKRDIKKLLIKAGFKTIRISFFNILLSPPIVIIRLLSKLGGPLARLADFDSRINYDISKRKAINATLIKIFSLESLMLKYMDIPFGTSLLTLTQKIK